MRPQQQNRRMRGRGGNNNNNNNNRRGPNPLTRNYESNGPDVKIRGSAQQIAEKYATLARDAQSAGDRVMAENYLQHAEHYNRIIAAAQAQQAAQQQNFRDEQDDDADDDRDEGANETTQQRPAQDRSGSDGSGPQPVIEGTPAEVALEQEQIRSNEGEGRRERVNGAHASAHAPNGAASDEDGQPRRGRRPRRSRGRDRDGEAGEDRAEGEAPSLVPAED